jgi:predicted RNA polymerase sigma factor
LLAQSSRLFDIGDTTEFSVRLSAVQRALYLLFNEGYHSASPEFAVRGELCREAIRLVGVLQEHPWGSTPATDALAALMCFNVARLPTRTDAAGDLIALGDQDRTTWDRSLIADGEYLLQRSARGPELTAYHVEAAIAWVHASAACAEDTNWSQVVALYAMLMAVGPSPVVALNRAARIACD